VEVVVSVPHVAVLGTFSEPFEERFPVLFQAAYRTAYRMLGTRAEAEDVAAESCARAYSRWRTVASYGDAWCVHVAANLARDTLRARIRAAERRGLVCDTERRSETEAAAVRLDLHRAIDELPRRQREVVTLRYFGDLSEQQIAEVLGVSEGSVKTHASRGLARLREVVSP
jgi:RNA polymerase sigma factor (sigma-70 family)